MKIQEISQEKDRIYNKLRYLDQEISDHKSKLTEKQNYIDELESKIKQKKTKTDCLQCLKKDVELQSLNS